jgi:RNA recognition motif-containing protein
VAVELLIDALPQSYTEEQLQSLFQPYGSVSSVSIVRAPDGQSLGFGYVTMASAEDAWQACRALQSRVMGTRRLIVEEKATRGLTEGLDTHGTSIPPLSRIDGRRESPIASACAEADVSAPSGNASPAHRRSDTGSSCEGRNLAQAGHADLPAASQRLFHLGVHSYST